MNKTGFGFLRLPRLDKNDEKSIDYGVLNRLTDRFLELGGRYFDTAYTYLGGMSEAAIKNSLVLRHPRESFILADKLPGYRVTSHEECNDYFEESCRRCGVDYFDVYLLHWLNDKNYELAEKYDEFAFLRRLKAEGRARRIGFSYHDGPELLDRILTAHPEVDIVQIQLNYLDWDSAALKARELYEVVQKHKKTVVIMEPVKGGSLASVPEPCRKLLYDACPGRSPASWAMHFATGLENVETVLSGMKEMCQIEENMADMAPLDERELDVLKKAADIIRSNTAVPCTACGYCAPNCPIGMPIPGYFALFNEYSRAPQDGWKMQHAYDVMSMEHTPASACLECGACERNCPQKLEIISFLKKTAEAFEHNE